MSAPLSTEARRFVRLARAEIASAAARVAAVTGLGTGRRLDDILERHAETRLAGQGPVRAAGELRRLALALTGIRGIAVVEHETRGKRKASLRFVYPLMTGEHPLEIAKGHEPDTITLAQYHVTARRSGGTYEINRMAGAVSAHLLGRISERANGFTPEHAPIILSVLCWASAALVQLEVECSIFLRLGRNGQPPQSSDLFLVGVIRGGYQRRHGELELIFAPDWRTAMRRHMLAPLEQQFGDMVADGLVDPSGKEHELPYIAPRPDYITRLFDEAE